MTDPSLNGRHVLVTGGAGFIGSHLVRLLATHGAEVRVLDNFDPQAHPDPDAPRPDLPAEVVRGDVRDAAAVRGALEGVTDVVHFAAMVGVGQSMYEIVRYSDVNVMGTATLLEAMIEDPGRFRRLLVASSMSIYGEGAYRCDACDAPRAGRRSPDQLALGVFEPQCPVCDTGLTAEPTPETKPIEATSIYALNKRDHEDMCLVTGSAYDIPTVAMRFFNVYGPGQSLMNPYTGVAAIFAARLLGDAPPLVFEDGRQSRDFISVHDLVRGCMLALADDGVDGEVINLATGVPMSIVGIAEDLRAMLGGPEPQLLGTYRAGDIRHCFGDPTRAKQLLGWEPRVSFAEGMEELALWQRDQATQPGQLDQAVAELRSRGLVAE